MDEKTTESSGLYMPNLVGAMLAAFGVGVFWIMWYLPPIREIFYFIKEFDTTGSMIKSFAQSAAVLWCISALLTASSAMRSTYKDWRANKRVDLTIHLFPLLCYPPTFAIAYLR